MPEGNNPVIVSLIPQDDSWCIQPEAHMTMIYAAQKKSDLNFLQIEALKKETYKISKLFDPIKANIVGTYVLGQTEEEKVDVFLIQRTPEIMSIRRMLESWDKSDFSTFKPHTTIGPQGSYAYKAEKENPSYPKSLLFDRISIFWGEERFSFSFQKL